MKNLSRAITLSLSLRVFGLLVAGLSAAVAGYLFIQQQRVEPALRYKCDLPAFVQITSNCLEEVSVPVNRKFEVMSSRKAIEGQWTVHSVATGEMAHSSQLTGTPPDRFRFTASGEPLPEGVWAYFFGAPKQILGVVKPGNDLTLSLTDPLTHQLVVVLDKVDILERLEDGIFLGLTMDQIAAVERLLEDAQAQNQPGDQPRPELVWVVTQGKNPDLPPLAMFKMELTKDTLARKE